MYSMRINTLQLSDSQMIVSTIKAHVELHCSVIYNMHPYTGMCFGIKGDESCTC